ncbi:hypothetical protein ACP3P8_16720 [Pseudomonas aeruginosa]
MSEREHWQRVYESKPSDAVSWFQAEATLSLDLIRRIGAPREAAIIDVGGGARPWSTACSPKASAT